MRSGVSIRDAREEIMFLVLIALDLAVSAGTVQRLSAWSNQLNITMQCRA